MLRHLEKLFSGFHRVNVIRWLAWYISVGAAAMSLFGCEVDVNTQMVKKLGVYEYGHAPGGVNMAYFDHEGMLQWDSQVRSDAALVACDSEFSPGFSRQKHTWDRKTVLASPQVDVVSCPGGKRSLVGFDANGEVLWNFDLKASDYKFYPYLSIIGVSASTIILSNLTVIAPSTGNVLRNAPAPNLRTGPVLDGQYTVNFPTVYRRASDDFLVYDNDGGLFANQRGLYLLNPTTSESRLLYAGDSFPFRKTVVNSMALVGTGQYLAMAATGEARGPGHPALQIIELQTNELVFREFYRDALISVNPRVSAGSKADLVFSFINRNSKKHTLIYYRIGALPKH